MSIIYHSRDIISVLFLFICYISFFAEFEIVTHPNFQWNFVLETEIVFIAFPLWLWQTVEHDLVQNFLGIPRHSNIRSKVAKYLIPTEEKYGRHESS